MPQTATDPRTTSPTPIPPGLMVAATGWFIVGTSACVAGLGTGRTSHSRTGVVGSDVVTATVADTPSTVLVAAAVVVWLLAAALVVGGQGWSVYPLSVIGAALVVSLALSGNGAVVAVMVGLVLGTAPLAGRSAYGFITGGETR